MCSKEEKEEESSGWVDWRDCESAGLEGAKGKLERIPAGTSGFIADSGGSLEHAPEEGACTRQKAIVAGRMASSLY